MKTFKLNVLASILAIASVLGVINSCTEDENLADPKVSLTEVLSEAYSFTFFVDVEDAEECYYYFSEGVQSDVSASDVMEKGQKLQEAKSQNVKISSLKPSTDYNVVAVACSGSRTAMSEPLVFRTSDISGDGTSVSVVAGDSEETVLNFTVIPANADKCSWLCVEKSDDIPSASDIFEKGNALEDPSKATYCTADNLSTKTEYMIVAAASSEDGEPVVSEPVYMTTKEPQSGADMQVYIEDITATYNSITFTVIPKNAGEAAYDFELKTEDYIYRDANDVFSRGKKLESAMNPSTVTIDGLKDDCVYVLYAEVESAASYDKEMTYVEVRTEKRPDAEELPLEDMSKAEMTYNTGKNYTLSLENDNYSVVLDMNSDYDNPEYLPHIHSHEYIFEKGSAGDDSWVLNFLTSVTAKGSGDKLDIVKGSVNVEYNAPSYSITGRLVTEDNKAFNFKFDGNIPYLLKASSGEITEDGSKVLTLNCTSHMLALDFGDNEINGQHEVGNTLSKESSLTVSSDASKSYKLAEGTATVSSPEAGTVNIDALLTLDNGDIVSIQQEGVKVAEPEEPGAQEIIFDVASARGGPGESEWVTAYDITLENDEWEFYIAFDTFGDYDELPEGKLIYSSWGGGEISAYRITHKDNGTINDIDEGYMDVRKDGSGYKIELHFVRDNQDVLDGKYTGPVECTDMSGSAY